MAKRVRVLTRNYDNWCSMVTGLLYWTRDINFCNSLNEFEFLKVFRLNPLNSLCLS